MERRPPMTALDHASMDAAVRASFRGIYGREPSGIPGSGVDDVNYWISVSDHYGEFSDHVERAGWSAYWEVKLGGSDSANPALGDQPARFRPVIPAPVPADPGPVVIVPLPPGQAEIVRLQEKLTDLTHKMEELTMAVGNLTAKLSGGLKLHF